MEKVLIHEGSDPNSATELTKELHKNDSINIVIVLNDKKLPELLSDEEKNFVVFVSTSEEKVKKFKNEYETEVLHIAECNPDYVLEVAKS